MDMKIIKLNNNYNACKRYGFEMGVIIDPVMGYSVYRTFEKFVIEMFGECGRTIKQRGALEYQWHVTENDMWARDYFNKKPQIFYFKADALTMLLLRLPTQPSR